MWEIWLAFLAAMLIVVLLGIIISQYDLIREYRQRNKKLLLRMIEYRAMAGGVPLPDDMNTAEWWAG